MVLILTATNRIGVIWTSSSGEKKPMSASVNEVYSQTEVSYKMLYVQADSSQSGMETFVTGGEMTQEEVDDITSYLKEWKAGGIIDHTLRTTIVEKSYQQEIDLEKGMDKAIADYCANTFGEHADEVAKECLKLMN
mgnify:CR=1 FL=1